MALGQIKNAYGQVIQTDPLSKPLGTISTISSGYTPYQIGGSTTQYKYVSPLEAAQANLLNAQAQQIANQKWQKVDPVLVETDAQKAAKSYLSQQMNTDQLYGGQRFADTSAYDTARKAQLDKYLAGSAEQNALMGIANRNITDYTNSQYTGDRFAQNEYADTIKKQLSDYLSGTQSTSLLDKARGVTEGTLAGQFDPNTSQYYKGLRDTAKLSLSDALNRLSQGSYLKGNLRSTTTDAARGRLLAQNEANMNTVLGQLAQQERQNQLSAVGMAQSLAGQYENQAQNRLGQTQATSEYLRGLSQQEKDLAYQQYVDRLERQSKGASLAQSLAGSMEGMAQGRLAASNEYNQYMAQKAQKEKDFAYEQWKANLDRKQNLANTLFTTPQTYMYPQYQLR